MATDILKRNVQRKHMMGITLSLLLTPLCVSSVMAHNGVMKAAYIVPPIIALQIQYKYKVNPMQEKVDI